jgi:hypothetical protein
LVHAGELEACQRDMLTKEELKTIFSGLKIYETSLSGQIDFLGIFPSQEDDCLEFDRFRNSTIRRKLCPITRTYATMYSVRPKTWPFFENMPPPLCVSCRSQIFFSGRYIYVQYIMLSYVGKSGQDEAFHKAISITLRQKLYIKNTVWKNAVYSITNLDIDMKILNNM